MVKLISHSKKEGIFFRTVTLPELASIKPVMKGDYIICLKMEESLKIDYLHYRDFILGRGCYYYIGSARGTGGLYSRINRHLKKDTVIHWHIDKLKAAAEIQEIYLFPEEKKLECKIANQLGKVKGAIKIPSFGCSDCGCASHLIYSSNKIDIQTQLKIPQ